MKEKETKEAERLHKRMARGLNPMQCLFVDAIDYNKLSKVLDKKGK